MAVGQLGIQPAAFWDMDYLQLLHVMRHYNKKQTAEYQRQMEVTRWALGVYINTNVERSKRQPAHKWLPLPWDPAELQEQKRVSTKQRFEYLKNKWA